MNGQSAKGGSYGFSLSDIQKTSEVKGNDGTTLLAFLIGRIEQEKKLCFDDVTKQLKITAFAAEISTSQLDSELAEIR